MPDGEIISSVAVFLGLAAALYYTPIVISRRAKADQRLIALCGIGWTVALASLFLLRKVWLVIGEIVHIPSFSWLLSFLFLAACYHYILQLSLIALRANQRITQITEYIAVLFMAVLTLVFFVGGVAFSNLPLERVVPRYFGELLYMGLLHAYSIAVFIGPVVVVLKTVSGSSTRELRLRALILVASCSCAIIFSAAVIVLGYLSVFMSLQSNFLPELKQTALVFFAVAILAWPFAFVPARWISFPTRLWHLRRLVYLYRRLKAEYEYPVAELPRRWWTRIGELEYYIDTIVVFVLDTKWLVMANRLAIRDRRVLAVLNTLDETLPRERLIVECGNLSAHLKLLDQSPHESVFQ